MDDIHVLNDGNEIYEAGASFHAGGGLAPARCETSIPLVG
jgi:hypothetical protein